MFVSLFRSFAAANPVKTAVVCHGQSISYGEMDAEVRRVSKYLALMGVSRGTRVIIALPNSITYLVLYHALADTGAVIMPLPRDLILEAITDCLGGSEPDFCLVAGELALPYQQVCAGLGRGLVVSDSTRPFSLAEMAQRNPACITPMPRLSPDDPLMVHHHWHGVTRGAGHWYDTVQSHRNHIQRLLSWSRTAQLTAEDSTLCIDPLCNFLAAESLALPALACGQTLYLMDERRATPEAVTDLISGEKITLFGAGEAFYRRLLDAPLPRCRGLQSLRITLCDTGSLSEDLTPAFIRRFGVPLNYTYSLPETALALVNLKPGDGNEQIPIGSPLHGVESAVHGFGPVAEGVGELWLRAESIAATSISGQRFCDGQGWLPTGALVRRQGGCFYLLGQYAPQGLHRHQFRA
ncbi:MAG: hypothetical protein EA349_06410 [Halomonadaceae bacterium]|nr:MAG: hypothetical protein EA349_06410 [Halomonadaceae bacterium]